MSQVCLALELCDKPVLCRSLCNKHYRRFIRSGTTELLGRRKCAKVCKFCGDVDVENFYFRYSKICKRCCVVQNICNKFDISRDDFNKAMSAQDNKCAICKVSFDISKQEATPCLDHDHESGRIRGFLCYSCNMLMGHVDRLENEVSGRAKEIINIAVDYKSNFVFGSSDSRDLRAEESPDSLGNMSWKLRTA
jgi:hypothetical protein